MDVNVFAVFQSAVLTFLFPFFFSFSQIALTLANGLTLVSKSSDTMLDSLIISLLSVDKMLQDHLVCFLP